MIANVTPTQLYGPLLGNPAGAVAEAGRRFRYGRAEMQIHFALSEPPRWDGDERLAKTAIVHVTPGLDGVSRAVNEAERGLLPAEATVVCGQPLAIDPSRAPEGKGMLWIQLQELPWQVKGDAAGELDPGDGTWTEELRERYADRIQERLARPTSRTSRRSIRAGRRSRRPTCRRPTRTCTTATPTPARSRSTRTSSGARSRRGRGTARRSTGSGTSAPAPGPGPGLGAGSGTMVALGAPEGARRRAHPAAVPPALLLERLRRCGKIGRHRATAATAWQRIP